MTTKIVVDCSTGVVEEVELTEEELAQREAELKKERAIYKALEEYKHRKKISDEEYKLRIDFIKKYGTKEWQKLLDIKTEIERLEREDKKYFDAELSKVKWVQFWCFLVAAWIAYYMVWGSKK